MNFRYGLMAVCALSLLSACSSKEGDSINASEKTGKQAKVRSAPIPKATGETLGTPIAIIGFLNKRNGQTRDLELKPGEALRFGKVVIRVRACERTAPWETYPDQGAFVQLIVRERPPGTTDAERWRTMFSGWLFKENPAANVVQHPIYDVWVKECRMSFPGEEETPSTEPSDDSDVSNGDAPAAPKKPSNAPQAKPNEPAPPADEPEAEVTEEETVIT
jgi:hypothetical protein